MFSRPAVTAAALALASLTLAVPQTVRADAVTIMSVQSGHSIVLNTGGLTRVAVGDSRIAGVVPIGTSQLVVNGKSPGHTTVMVWTGKRRSTYEITVTEQALDDIARMLRSSISDPEVQVVSFNNSVVVRGNVSDQARFAALSDVVSRFDKLAAHGNYAIVNAVTISHPLGNVQEEMNALPGTNDVRLDPDGKGDVIVSGQVHDAVQEEAVMKRARGLAGAYLGADGKVIDRLSTELTSQVDVKVYVLEVDKTFANTLGIRLQGAQIQQGSTAQSILYTLTPPSFVGLEGIQPYLPGRVLNIGEQFSRQTLLAPTLDLLLSQGHARILSSPDLVTLPGQEATFLVGGQIPIPVSQGLGAISIEYKDYGVNLKVTPTLLGNGSVQTKINPEISDLDFSNGVTLNGYVIPALKVSKLSTNVITQSGESIVLGGLLRRMEQKNVTKIPLLGDLPILGKLFRSTAYQQADTDVVFVMTPTILSR
jgi:Flp pilus assembly secretin CpaC